MSRRLTRISLALVLLLSSEVWAIGLGDIRLDSALNEPLRAEISLLSATPDELSNLTISLASADTFSRYGIDRPAYLQDIEFSVVSGPNGSSVQLRSPAPMTEPFLTFLVEATWPSGRLLREYTVLLDPPTFTPPAAQQAPAISAPRPSAPADSGRIERQQPAAQPSSPSAPPAAQPPRPAQPAPSPAVDDSPYDRRSGADYVVQRSETLWGIASRMRPDNRLTMNQMMLAIYEANPDAFGGNINVLRAGATLRIPSADQVFQISRGEAFSEAQRQNEAWAGGSGYTAPAPTETETRPSLTLVPPDEEPTDLTYDDDLDVSQPLTREQEIENRIDELEAADVPDQPSLLEIRDNELATLRQELANIRGEVYEPPVEVTDDPFVEEPVADETGVDEVFPDDDELIADDDIVADDEVADGAEAADDESAVDTAAPSDIIRTAPSSEPGIVERILGLLTGFWGLIIGAVVLVAGLLFWFMRRGSSAGDESGPWETLDSDELDAGAMTASETLTATETMHAPTADEAIVVVEQDSAIRPLDETVEVAAADGADDTGSFGSLEDTFSSETAVNLDQTDPIAEADFHMAYGLYDQAADLINGALESDPEDTGLMSKLCEIYFVWGNRDAFVDSATKMKSAIGDGENPEWDKIVIMGQQIAGDSSLFAGAGVAAVTKEMDLSFEADEGDAGALDMDFGGDEADEDDVIDLGADDGSADDDVDIFFDDPAAGDAVDVSLEPTAESPTIEAIGTEKTVEMPTPDTTVEAPTVEQPMADLEGTSELPSLDESLEQAISDTGQDAGATAEINLDDLDLDLDIDGLAETELASLDDLDSTGANEELSDDLSESTGKNPEVDPNSTGVRESLKLDDFIDPDATGEMRLAADETGMNPMLDPHEESTGADFDFDDTLLDATGRTQILSETMAVETASDVDDLLPGDDDVDFDFAKTEALPAEAFEGSTELEETGEMPAVVGTDVDLDLDDLTEALKLSDAGDTVEQPRDDKTVEQPRPSMDEAAGAATVALAPEDFSEDLHEARTMTEVGTKLDLARAYVDMGDPAGARSILEEVLDEGDEGQRQQAQQLLDSLQG